MDYELEEGEIPSPPPSPLRNDYYDLVSDDSDVGRQQKRPKPKRHRKPHKRRCRRLDHRKSVSAVIRDFDRSRQKLLQRLKTKQANIAADNCKELPASEIADVEMQDVYEPIVIDGSDDETELEQLRVNALHSKTRFAATIDEGDDIEDEAANEFKLRAEALKTAIIKKRQSLLNKKVSVKLERLKGANSKGKSSELRKDDNIGKENLGSEKSTRGRKGRRRSKGRLTSQNEQGDTVEQNSVICRPAELALSSKSDVTENVCCDLNIFVPAAQESEVLEINVSNIPLPTSRHDEKVPVEEALLVAHVEHQAVEVDVDEEQLRALLLSEIKLKRGANSSDANLDPKSSLKPKLLDLGDGQKTATTDTNVNNTNNTESNDIAILSSKGKVAVEPKLLDFGDEQKTKLINTAASDANVNKTANSIESNDLVILSNKGEIAVAKISGKLNCSGANGVQKVFGVRSNVNKKSMCSIRKKTNIAPSKVREPNTLVLVGSEDSTSTATQVEVNTHSNASIKNSNAISRSSSPLKTHGVEKHPKQVSDTTVGAPWTSANRKRVNPFTTVSTNAKRPVSGGAVGKRPPPKRAPTMTKRLVIPLREDSSDDDGQPPLQAKLVSSVDEYLQTIRRLGELPRPISNVVQPPTTPEAIHAHLPPSQRIEYIRLKQKLAAAENEKIKKNVVDGSKPTLKPNSGFSEVEAIEQIVKPCSTKSCHTTDAKSEKQKNTIKELVPELPKKVAIPAVNEMEKKLADTALCSKVGRKLSDLGIDPSLNVNEGVQLEIIGAKNASLVAKDIAVPKTNLEMKSPTGTPNITPTKKAPYSSMVPAKPQEKAINASIPVVNRNLKIKRLSSAPTASKKTNWDPMTGVVNRVLHDIDLLKKEVALEKIARNEIKRLKEQMIALERKRQGHQTRMEHLSARVQRLLAAVEKNDSSAPSKIADAKLDAVVGIQAKDPAKPATTDLKHDKKVEASNHLSYFSPLNPATSAPVCLDPLREMCPHDLSGVCRDPECQYQHMTVITDAASK